MKIDISLAVLLSILTLVMAYLGVHVTIHPAEVAKTKAMYKIGFWICGGLAVVLIALQTYRNEQTQSSIRGQLASIEKNTKQPPTVEVQNNIPSPVQRTQVVFGSGVFTQYVKDQPLIMRLYFANSTSVPAQHVVASGHLFIVPFQPSVAQINVKWHEFEKSFGPAYIQEGMTLVVTPMSLQNPPFTDANGPTLTQDDIDGLKEQHQAILLTASLLFKDDGGGHRYNLCSWAIPPDQGQIVAATVNHFCPNHNGIEF